MGTGRLEAFSDGVLAIIITIMVLELDVPKQPTLASLGGSASGFLTYALSFVYVGIYWNNHHHMFQLVDQVTGAVLWANLHLLFWLSLLPFSTKWMDEHFVTTPTIAYGVNLLLAAIAFYLIELAVFNTDSGDRLRSALGRDLKGKMSPLIYLAGIALTFLQPWLGIAMFVTSALVWLVPDRRVERFLSEQRQPT